MTDKQAKRIVMQLPMFTTTYYVHGLCYPISMQAGDLLGSWPLCHDGTCLTQPIDFLGIIYNPQNPENIQYLLLTLAWILRELAHE